MDAVQNKVEEVIESKTEEVIVKVDEVLDNIEKTEVVIDVPKPVEEIIEKVEKIEVVKDVIENVVEVVDGRTFSCSIFGWLLSLHITRKQKTPPQTKSEDIPNKPEVKPSQDIPQEKSLQPSSAQ